MDDWLRFQYHRVRARADPGLLREALRGLPTRPALGQRWGDAEG
jgi:hypothetical protein